MYLGGEKITPQMRSILRDQAYYLLTSELWEVMDATIINESSNIALIQSTEFKHVENAKMLYHWGFVFKNLITKLAK